MPYDHQYMQRAIELAGKGLGEVNPNPVVGCVIVCDNKIIGEGYHQQFGGPHAEVMAVNSVQDQGLLAMSDVYVTLEPCSHYGKTPPCADLLIEKSVKRVYIGCLDPYEEVNGLGIEKMKRAGIEVISRVLSDECWWMNRRFMTFHEQKRPFVILKWAQTNDGFIARENYDSKWISNEMSRKLVHKWRAEEDAILVGKNTAIHDDPSLTVRDWPAHRNPKRVVLDMELELQESLNLFRPDADTFIFNGSVDQEIDHMHYVKFDGYLSSMLSFLHEQKIQSIIVEGGAHVLNQFISQNVWDEARVFTSVKEFGSGIVAPDIAGQILEDHRQTGDQLVVYKNVHERKPY